MKLKFGDELDVFILEEIREFDPAFSDIYSDINYIQNIMKSVSVIPD